MTTPTPVRIVDHDPDLVPEMTDLWVESWVKTMPSIDFEARRGWFLDHVATLVASGSHLRLAVTADDAVAGFVAVDPATGYLDQIAVAPAHWGKGVAEALLTEARRLSPERIELDVNQDNLRAVAFYMRSGFRVIGEGVNARSGLTTLKLEWTARPVTDDPAP